MCGIFGIIDKTNDINRNELQTAIDIVRHRGPDDEGFYISNNIGFAHKRLAIFDLSENAAQPMYFKDLVIVFNGAIYNFVELKKELEGFGYKFKTRSDTEVILAAYDKWGQDCVHRFNGMWAFAIYDIKRNKVFASRDRFGIKPLYFTEINSKFCFASEIKQFTVVDGWQPQMNKNVVLEFLINNYVDFNEETFFKDVFKLKKGHNLIYDLKQNAYEIYEYYNLENIKIKPAEDFEKEKEEFKHLLIDSIRLRYRADVEVGATLSGGLDSTSIVSVLSKILDVKPQTISSYFKDKGYDEEYWIDVVINKFSLNAHKISPDLNKVFEEFDNMIWHYDEPFQRISNYTQFKVFEVAKQYNLKVMLSGQGADEILCGYEKFYYRFILKLIKNYPVKALIDMFHFFVKHSISPLKAAGILIKAFSKNKIDKSPPKWLNNKFISQNYQPFKRSHESTIRDISINFIYEVGISTLLHSEDRNSMAFSIESRLPFLDYRLVEKALSMPDDYKIKKGIRKYILRESLKGILPPEVYKRYDKLGFPTPQKQWYEKNKDRIFSELNNNFKYIENIVNRNIFEIDDDKIIWRVLTLARWIKLFKVKI